MDDENGGTPPHPMGRPIGTGVAPGYAMAPPATHGATNLHELLTGLRRHWWLVLLIPLTGAAGAAFLVKREVPQYVGAALIRLVDERSALTGSLGDPAVSGVKTGEWIQSQLLVLLGRGVAGEVVDREGFRLTSQTVEFRRGRLEDVHVAVREDGSDTLLVRFGPNTVSAARSGVQASARYGEPLDLGDVRFIVRDNPGIAQASLHVIPREAAIEAVMASRSAWARQGTDAIEVRFTSTDPRLAVRGVNALVEAFRDENARSAQQQAARRRAFLEEQLEQNASELRRAQGALIDFRSQRNLYSSTERIAAEQSALLQLETRRQELDSDLRLFRTMLTRAQAAEGEDRHRLLEALVSAPGLGENAQIAQLRDLLLTHRAALAELNTQYTELHPSVKRARNLFEQTQEQLTRAVEMHIATMEARVAALDDLRDQTVARLEPLPAAEAEELRLVQEVESARILGDQLRAEYQRARTTEATEAGQVSIVNLAARATTGSRHPWLKLAIGALTGLALAIGLSMLLETMNTSIRQQNELTRLLQVPELGMIPAAGVDGKRRGARRLRIKANGAQNGAHGGYAGPAGLITAARTHSVGSEAYRTLRTTLMFSEFATGLKTFVVTSACVGDGKTTVVANLAVSFAQQGFRVLLIDADLRRPRLHELFDQPRRPGLSDLLTLSSDADQAVRRTAVHDLDLIPSGTTPVNPAELLGGERMRVLLESMSAEYDLVLIDAPPVLGAADPIVLGAKVDGVLFVVRAGHTGRDAAQHAMVQLERVRARVLGTVLNDPDAVAARYGRAYGYLYASDD